MMLATHSRRVTSGCHTGFDTGHVSGMPSLVCGLSVQNSKAPERFRRAHFLMMHK